MGDTSSSELKPALPAQQQSGRTAVYLFGLPGRAAVLLKTGPLPLPVDEGAGLPPAGGFPLLPGGGHLRGAGQDQPARRPGIGPPCPPRPADPPGRSGARGKQRQSSPAGGGAGRLLHRTRGLSRYAKETSGPPLDFQRRATRFLNDLGSVSRGAPLPTGPPAVPPPWGKGPPAM